MIDDLTIKRTIAKYPHLHKFFDEKFLENQLVKEPSCYILKMLKNTEYSARFEVHLAYLERQLEQLKIVLGYMKLGHLLRMPSDWDQYQNSMEQIYISVWFKRTGVLREIEPALPNRIGGADVLLFFEKQIYCEITSLQSLAKTISDLSRQKYIEDEIHRLKKITPWREDTGLEHDVVNKRGVTTLLDKAKRQLPSEYPGILAISTTKSGFFSFDIKERAKNIFPQQKHVLGIMLWSGESDQQVDDRLSWKTDRPNFFYLNPCSEHLELGKKLSESLNLKYEIIAS